MYNQSGNAPFMVWNKSTSDAKGYHKNMKMCGLEKFVSPTATREDKERIINYLVDYTRRNSDEQDDSVRRSYITEDINSPNAQFLFYLSSKINYDELVFFIMNVPYLKLDLVEVVNDKKNLKNILNLKKYK
jgi:hypothetical protein